MLPEVASRTPMRCLPRGLLQVMVLLIPSIGVRHRRRTSSRAAYLKERAEYGTIRIALGR